MSEKPSDEEIMAECVWQFPSISDVVRAVLIGECSGDVCPVEDRYLSELDKGRKLLERIRTASELPLPECLEYLHDECVKPFMSLREKSSLAGIEQDVESLVAYSRLHETAFDFVDAVTMGSVLEAEEQGGVCLGSVHYAKGREWSVVIILNVIEGIMPDERSSLEEEERVFYVAATRACDMLYILIPQWRQGRATEVSRYLEPHMAVMECQSSSETDV